MLRGCSVDIKCPPPSPPPTTLWQADGESAIEQERNVSAAYSKCRLVVNSSASPSPLSLAFQQTKTQAHRPSNIIKVGVVSGRSYDKRCPQLDPVDICAMGDFVLRAQHAPIGPWKIELKAHHHHSAICAPRQNSGRQQHIQHRAHAPSRTELAPFNQNLWPSYMTKAFEHNDTLVSWVFSIIIII